jgi:hypothetical protein
VMAIRRRVRSSGPRTALCDRALFISGTKSA